MDFDKVAYWGLVKESKLHLNVCYIYVGDTVKDIFEAVQAWVSATLGYWNKKDVPKTKEDVIQDGYFKNFIDNIFPEEIVKTRDIVQDIFKSTFRFKEQVALYLPQNINLPAWQASQEQKDEYETILWKTIIELIQLANGGTLVLFTSHYMLNKATAILKDAINLPVYSQSTLGAYKAMEEFTGVPNGVLLGTQSFWQGIDIPGAQLRMLIVTKLMFPLPEDPLFKAREKQLKKQSRNAFQEISLPYANIMLRQGFGRLIRSQQDKGVIAILDSRILHKPYGKILLSNLPKVGQVHTVESLETLIDEKKLLNFDAV